MGDGVLAAYTTRSIGNAGESAIHYFELRVRQCVLSTYRVDCSMYLVTTYVHHNDLKIPQPDIPPATAGD